MSERQMPDCADPQDMELELAEQYRKHSVGREAAYERGGEDYQPGADREAAADASGFEGNLRTDYLDGWDNAAAGAK